jgi:hypothetical protein
MEYKAEEFASGKACSMSLTRSNKSLKKANILNKSYNGKTNLSVRGGIQSRGVCFRQSLVHVLQPARVKLLPLSLDLCVGGGKL